MSCGRNPRKKDVKNEGRTDYVYENKWPYDNLPTQKSPFLPGWTAFYTETHVFCRYPAISLFVKCETRQGVDELREKLSSGGKLLQCGWLNDKFAVSWRIIPTALSEMLSDPDPVKASRVAKDMMQMFKIDIKGLRQAYDQG